MLFQSIPPREWFRNEPNTPDNSSNNYRLNGLKPLVLVTNNLNDKSSNYSNKVIGEFDRLDLNFSKVYDNNNNNLLDRNIASKNNTDWLEEDDYYHLDKLFDKEQDTKSNSVDNYSSITPSTYTYLNKEIDRKRNRFDLMNPNLDIETR